MKKFARFGILLASATVPIAGIRSNLNWNEMSENFMQSQELPTNLYKLFDELIVKLNKKFQDVVIDMIRLEYI